MVDTCFTRARVIQMLLDACAEAGSQKALAERTGVSPAFLSDVLTGRREATDRLLGAIGMERRTIFVRRGARDMDVLAELNGGLHLTVECAPVDEPGSNRA
jgi:hypothetical protein